MTEKLDLDAIEKLLAAATPGEWRPHAGGAFAPTATTIWAPSPSERGKKRIVAEVMDAATDMPHDAALIVALRNAAPRMLSEIRALRRVAAAAKDVVAAKEGVFDSTGDEVRDEVFTAVVALNAALKEAGL